MMLELNAIEETHMAFEVLNGYCLALCSNSLPTQA